jgi:hypothetical protein
MDTETLMWIAYAIVGAIAFAVGWRWASNKAHGRKSQQDLTQIPYVGPLIDYGGWKPKNKKDWNVIINKALMVFYTLIAIWIPFMWIFVLIALVYEIEWISE